MGAPARLAGLALTAAAVGMAPHDAVGQTPGETGSDVQVASVTAMVSSVSLALVAGPAAAAAAAPTPQAFATALQVAVAQMQVDPGGELQARSQLGNFRTSILMRAGVLSFGGTPAPSPAPGGEAEQQSPLQANLSLADPPKSANQSREP